MYPYQQYNRLMDIGSNQTYATMPPSSNYMTIVPIDGEASMSMYPVGPGNTVFLIDFNSNKLWIKSKDINGIPLQTQRYKLSPDVESQSNNKQTPESNYVTMENFNKLLTVVNTLSDNFDNLMKELSPNKQ